MSTELIVAVFQDDEQAAETFLKKIHDAPTDSPITFESAVAVRKDQKGDTHVKHLGDLKHGARYGAITGAAIGLLAGPGGAVIGGLVGAGIGKLTNRLTDVGMFEHLEKETEQGLDPGASALLTYVVATHVENLVTRLENAGATVTHETVADDAFEDTATINPLSVSH